MSNEKSVFDQKYSHITFPKSFLSLWSSEAFEPLALPPHDERFENLYGEEYSEEAQEKRRRTVQLDFAELKAAFNSDDHLFSLFLYENLYPHLQEKRVPYISIKGFEALSESDQDYFMGFLNVNPYLLDCPPWEVTEEEQKALAWWPITVECKIKKLQPFLARNTFLACFSDQEKKLESNPDLWQQTAELMVHRQGANCSSKAFIFFSETTDTPWQTVLRNSMALMWRELFGPVVIYLKNRLIALSFTYSDISRLRQERFLNLRELNQLLQHISELKFNDFSLKVSAGYAEYPQLFATIASLLKQVPFECRSLKIEVPISHEAAEEFFKKNKEGKDGEEFFRELENFYKREGITTTLDFKFETEGGYDWDPRKPSAERELKEICETYTERFAYLASNHRREVIAKHPEKMKATFVSPPVKPDSTLWIGPGLKQRTISRRKQPKIALQHAQQRVVQQIHNEIQLQHRIKQNIVYPMTQETNLLDKKAFLKQFSEYRTLQMEFLWDNICGKASSLTKITWITPSVNEQIKRFDYIYQGGLVKGTQGFSITQKNGQRVLEFVSNSKEQPDLLWSLTPIPYLLYPELSNYGTLGQFRKSDKKSHEDSFKIAFCNEYKYFYEILGEHASLLEQYQHIFEPRVEEDRNRDKVIASGWVKLYVQCGGTGLENLLKALNTLHQADPKIFTQFRNNFLAFSEDFSEFADEKSLAIIKNIATFSENQLTWWHTLVDEHQRYLPKYSFDDGRSVSPINLIDLYEGFTSFLAQYSVLARQTGSEVLDLPPTCRFQNARNLKTSLYRLVDILKKARNFSEQVQHLEGLDLGLEGAYYASQSNDFSFVHAAMQLSPFSWRVLYAVMLDVSCHTNLKKLKEAFGDRLPAIIVSYTREDGLSVGFGNTTFLFTGEALIPLDHRVDWQTLDLEPAQNAKDKIRRVKMLSDSLKHRLLERASFLQTSSSSAGVDFLSYTVDGNLLLQKAFDNKFPFKSTDNSLDFVQLFYRALGPLDHTPPFQDIVKLVGMITDTFEDQPEKQKKLLCIMAYSLLNQQNQSEVPFNSLSIRLQILKLRGISSKQLDGALTLTKESSFTLVAAMDVLNGFALGSKSLISAIEVGDLFWKGLNHRGKYQNALELEVYLACFHQFKAVKSLLPLLSVIDKNGFSKEKLRDFHGIFDQLTPGVQADLAYLWSMLDSTASTASGKNLPTMDEWYSWLLLDLDKNKIQDYVTLEKTLFAKFPHLHMSVNIDVAKAISIEDFLQKNFSPEECEKYAPLFANPKKLIETIFTDLQQADRLERFNAIFSQETLLTILSAQAIKKIPLEPSLESQLLFLLTKKWAVGLAPEINSFAALSGFFQYVECCERFLGICQKLNTKVLEQLIPLFYGAKIAIHPENLTYIVQAILSQQKAVFPIDLLKQFLACENLGLFAESADENKLSAGALSLMIQICSLTVSSDIKELFLRNFLNSLEAIPVKNEALLFDYLLGVRRVIEVCPQATWPELLNLWHHFNSNHAQQQLIIIFEKLLPFIHGGPEHFQTHVLTYLQKHKPQDIKNLLETLEKAPEPQDIENLLETLEKARGEARAILIILASFHREEAAHSFEVLQEMVRKLRLYPPAAGVLAKACTEVPSPSFKQLQTFFQEFSIPTVKDAEAFVKKFNTQPHGPPDLAKQFNTDQVLRVIGKMVDGQGKPLSYVKQKQLRDCFIFINAIGNDYPIFKEKSIRALSRVEMRELWHEIQVIIQSEDSSSEQKLTARLIAIAVLRQVIERTSDVEKKEAIFPDSTQILDLVCANLSPGNTALEIPTGEGKSIVEAMQAAIFSLSGKPVVLATPRLAVAERNRRQFTDFFDYLGIFQANSVITENSTLETFVPGGIHYTSPSHFGLFKDKQALPNHVGPLKDKQALAASEVLSDLYMIVSEVDRTATNLTHMRHSRVMDASAEDKEVSAIDWIYPLVYEFLDRAILYEDKREAEINALKLFIENTTTPEQKEALRNVKISDDRLARWLDAAKALPTLKENIHYVVATVVEDSVEGKKALYKTLILEGEGEPSQNAEYSRAVQQMLCAKLNRELDIKDPTKQLPRYRITPEGAASTLLTHKNLLNQASDKKQLFVTTATLGSKQAIRRLIADFDLDTVIKVPHHQGDSRDRKTFLDKDANARAQRILSDIKACLAHNPPMPILLHAKNIEEAAAWNDLIQQKFANDPRLKKLQLYTGKDKKTYDCVSGNITFFSETGGKTIDQQVTEQAGVAGTITLSTLMIREIDIQPRYALDLASEKHPLGLFSGQSYFSSYCEEKQAAGRSGRRNTAGRAYFYVTEEELEQFEQDAEAEKLPVSLSAEKRIKRAQGVLEKQEAYKLKQHNVAGDYLRELYQYFLLLYNKVGEENRDEFHLRWMMALEELEDAWLDILEEKGIGDKHVDEEKLNQCIDQYLPLLRTWSAALESAGGRLRSKSLTGEMPTRPRFEPKQPSEVAPSLPEPVVIPSLSLPDPIETVQIYNQFTGKLEKLWGLKFDSQKLEKDVRAKINAFGQAISHQLAVKLELPEDIGQALLVINQMLLSHCDFNPSEITPKFKACLSLQNDLIQLLERLGSPVFEIQKEIAREMGKHYLRGLQNYYSAGTTTPLFAYYTQLKSWQATFPWFKLNSPENQNEFKSQVIQSVIKELESYQEAWGRSGDRIKAYDTLMLTLVSENDLLRIFRLLTAARAKALIVDTQVNKERRESWISLKQRNIDNSRYQKLLDSAIARVTLALEASGETELNPNEDLKRHLAHLSAPLGLAQNLPFDTSEKALKKLQKSFVEKDQQSIVNLLMQKSLLFSHINVTASKEESKNILKR